MTHFITITEIFEINSETGVVISSKKIINSNMENGEDLVPVAKAPKAKSTKKKSDPNPVGQYDLVLDSNKLILSSQALEKLGAESGDRISITYVELDKCLRPVISKSGVFGGASSGNVLSKTGTVSFRGNQFDTLKSFDTQFEFEESGDYFILKPINNPIIQTLCDDELIPMETIDKFKDDETFNTVFEENGLNYASKKEDITFDFEL